MTFHGIGLLVFSTILCESFVAPAGVHAALAKEGVRKLTNSLDTVFPDGASSQERVGSLRPALPLPELESDVDPHTQDGDKLVHTLPSVASRGDRLIRMAGAWSPSETNRRNQKNKLAKNQMWIQFQQDDSDDDDGCSSSSSSSESFENPPVSFARRRFPGRKRRTSGRRRVNGKYGSDSRAPNRKKKNPCRKHQPRETTTPGRVPTTQMITSPTTMTSTSSTTTGMTVTSSTTQMAMTTPPTVASESRTEAQFMTASTSSKPTREQTTQTESQPTTVTYPSTTEQVKTVGVVEPAK
ncbi:myosin-G heavy chain-like [Asterias rubens]|uniref:myosin-G heavy chain-like n=1 Tax=Asterias rubens TaxID=7604 RepID=UPI001454ED06|nr:myosin-G heavy chain-like [Asterias rubens]